LLLFRDYFIYLLNARSGDCRHNGDWFASDTFLGFSRVTNSLLTYLLTYLCYTFSNGYS